VTDKQEAKLSLG